jgi:hypothetical protein
VTDTPFSSFIGKLEAEGYSPRRGGNAQWSSLCPGHDDHRASLSIAEGDDGRVLVKCHATCATEDVVKALGTTMRDLYPDRANPRISLPRPNSRKRKTRMPATPQGKTFAFVPACVVETACVYCLALYAHLALRCGKDNLPQNGYNYLANALDIDPRTIGKHAEYLAGMGWIYLNASVSATGAYRSVQLSLRNCPPLGFVNKEAHPLSRDHHKYAHRTNGASAGGVHSMRPDPQHLGAIDASPLTHPMTDSAEGAVPPMRDALGTWKGNEHVGLSTGSQTEVNLRQQLKPTYGHEDERSAFDMEDDDPRLGCAPDEPIPEGLREAWTDRDLSDEEGAA